MLAAAACEGGPGADEAFGSWGAASTESSGTAADAASDPSSSGPLDDGGTDDDDDDDDATSAGPGDDGTTAGGDDGSDDGGTEDCTPIVTPPRAGFHVTPTGSPAGDGSEAAPWDIVTALDHPPAVAPGDTIYLHEGLYETSVLSVLQGTEGAPITVRSYPGEWAVVDGGSSGETTFRVQGGYTTYRDFEITNSSPDRTAARPEGYFIQAPGTRFLNLVIHDLGNNGFWASAVDAEIYGCLIYNNGTELNGNGWGHGMYMQNEVGTKRIADNILFHGFNFGIHAYTEGGYLDGFDIIGNIWFQAGLSTAGDGDRKDDCLVGGLQPASRVLLQENLGWASTMQTRSVRLGWQHPGNEDVTLVDNFFVGQTIFAQPWASVTMEGNRFYGPVSGVDAGAHPNNGYFDALPDTPEVFVRSNEYDETRHHVAIYNFGAAPSVDVGFEGVIDIGAPLTIRHVQDYFGEPVVDVIYEGGAVSVPMEPAPVAQPLGAPEAITETDRTGSAFGAFVVTAPRCER